MTRERCTLPPRRLVCCEQDTCLNQIALSDVLCDSEKIRKSEDIPDPDNKEVGPRTVAMLAVRALLEVSSGMSSDHRVKAFDEDTFDRLEDHMKLLVRDLPPLAFAVPLSGWRRTLHQACYTVSNWDSRPCG